MKLGIMNSWLIQCLTCGKRSVVFEMGIEAERVWCPFCGEKDESADYTLDEKKSFPLNRAVQIIGQAWDYLDWPSR